MPNNENAAMVEESKSVSFALDNAKKDQGEDEPQADDGCATKSNLSKRQRKRAKQKAGKTGAAEQEEGASVSES